MSDLHKLTGAYAVDALDDIERARFEQHLAACEDCRAEVVELADDDEFVDGMTYLQDHCEVQF